jgi:diguanylate cyclase (GGDEF)-like protein/PAS domain S-box-containing protein
VTDSADRLILWNNKYASMFPAVADILEPGIKYEVVVRKDMENGNYSEAVGEESEETWLEGRLQDHSQAGTTTDLKLNDGRWIRFDQHKTPDGKKVGVRTDITDIKNAAESFRLLFDNNPVPMFVFDQVSFAYLDVNNAAIEHYGYSRDEFLSMSLIDIRPARDRQKFLEHVNTQAMISNGELDWTHVKADGTEITINSYAKPINYYGVNAALSTAIDVTERRKHDTRMEYQANHDSLTDLPNRRLFLKRLEEALSVEDIAHQTAIILIDIDNFKSINDTLGHQAGDDLIKGVAKRVNEFIGERGTVGRLGGDEYAILLPSIEGLEAAKTLSTQLMALFSRTLKVEGRDMQIGISAGFALSGGVRITASTLLVNADLALYKAKSDGRGVYRFYEPRMSLKLLQHRVMEQDLRLALNRNQFEVYYQPLIDLEHGHVVGLEALLRWNHPEKGSISPSSFIPVLESNGMIIRIGSWVLQQACLLATTVDKSIKVAVNVSPVQFKSGGLVEVVVSALEMTGLAADRLELEITESILLEKSPEMLDVLNSLKALGVSIALDDFGTGFSGLGYLNSFTFDKIKIDRSFISGLGIGPKAEVIVRTALSVGHNLGITTLAEGIETQEQRAMLRSLGCNQGQGYLFSPAVPASQLPALLIPGHALVQNSK